MIQRRARRARRHEVTLTTPHRGLAPGHRRAHLRFTVRTELRIRPRENILRERVIIEQIQLRKSRIESQFGRGCVAGGRKRAAAVIFKGGVAENARDFAAPLRV